MVLLACSNQWIQGGNGATGLDLSMVAVVMGILEVKDRKHTLWGLKVMEGVILEELSK